MPLMRRSGGVGRASGIALLLVGTVSWLLWPGPNGAAAQGGAEEPADTVPVADAALPAEEPASALGEAIPAPDSAAALPATTPLTLPDPLLNLAPPPVASAGEPLAGTPPVGLPMALALQAPFEFRLAAAVAAFRTASASVESHRVTATVARSSYDEAVVELAGLERSLESADEASRRSRTKLDAVVIQALMGGRAAEHARQEIGGPEVLVPEARLAYLGDAGNHLARLVADRATTLADLRGTVADTAERVQRLEVELAGAESALRAAEENTAAARLDLQSAADLVRPESQVVPGVPNRVLDAYVRAAQLTAVGDPGCGMSWWALAAVGRVESGNAAARAVAPDGRVEPEVLGPRLTGGEGTARIADSDGGALDRDDVLDRAVGPMQFIPTTWVANGSDASGDGLADPHNIYDAAYTAARYLCAAAGELRVDTEAGFRRGAYSYNHSWPYVDRVWSGSDQYRRIAADAAAATLTWAAMTDPGGVGQ